MPLVRKKLENNKKFRGPMVDTYGQLDVLPCRRGPLILLRRLMPVSTHRATTSITTNKRLRLFLGVDVFIAHEVKRRKG